MTWLILVVGLLLTLVLVLLAVLLAGQVVRMFGGEPRQTVQAVHAIVPGLWSRWKSGPWSWLRTASIVIVAAILVAGAMFLPAAVDALSYRVFLASNEGRDAKSWCSIFGSVYSGDVRSPGIGRPSARTVEQRERTCMDAKWREWRRKWRQG